VNNIKRTYVVVLPNQQIIQEAGIVEVYSYNDVLKALQQES